MGMFDNFFSNLDDMLKDIEEGGLEKRLDNLAGMLDKGTEQVVQVTDKLANAPAKAIETFDKTAGQVEEKMQVIGQQGKNFKDILTDQSK